MELLTYKLLLALCFVALLFFMPYFLKIRNNLHSQNIRSMNLYLDKKFINKLLSLMTERGNIDRLQNLMDEIIGYFCLDFLALRVESEDKILTFRSLSTSKYYTEKELGNLMRDSRKIGRDVGYIKIKEDSNSEYIIFKNNQVTLLAVVEAKHELTIHEKDTLGNEILNMIKIAIFTSVNKKVSLRDFR
jgi:hypothetical protein